MKSVGYLKSIQLKQGFIMLVPLTLLLVLFLFGTTATMVGCAVGLVILSIVYRESLHGHRGTYSTVMCLTAATALGAVLAFAFKS